MTRNILFKTLVDILFLFQVIGIIGIIFVMPFGVSRINMMDLPVAEWTVVYWGILLMSVIGYVLFVVGLYHLRKMARQLLSNKYLDLSVVKHLNNCGKYFVASGSVGFLFFILTFIVKLTKNKMSLYDSDIMIPLFMTMIGLFFLIQSEVILNAKNFKDDSELTI